MNWATSSPPTPFWSFFFYFAKVKRNNFLAKLFLYQNISLTWNKMFHLVADVQETKGNESPTAPTSLLPYSRIANDKDNPGSGTPGSSPRSAWRGFNLHLLWNEIASHCTILFSLLTADVLVFIKICARAVNIEEIHTGNFFTLMVKAWCGGERILAQINASLNIALPHFAWH